MNARELVVKITSVFGKSGEPPIAEVKQLSEETKKAVSASKDLTSAASNNAPAVAKTGNELQKASQAAWAMRMASTGSTEGLRGLTNAAANMGMVLGSLVARVTMLGAAFSAGWNVGQLIRQKLIDPLLEARNNVNAVKESVGELEKQFGQINSAQMDSYIANLKELVASSETVLANLQRAYAQDQQIRASTDRAKLSGIEADMPPGPERDKAIAQRTMDNSVRESAKARVAAYSTIDQQKVSVTSADMEVASVQNARDAAAARYQKAESRRKQLGGGSPADDLDLIRDQRIAMNNLEEAEKKLTDAKKAREAVAQHASQVEIEQQKNIEVATNDITTAENVGRAAITKADTQIAERTASTTVEMPEGGNADIRTGIALRETRRAQKRVLPFTREDDGTFSQRDAGVTKRAGQTALGEAGKRIASGENEAQVLLDVAAKMKAVGAMYEGGFTALRDAIDAMDGKMGTMKASIERMNSRERSNRSMD